MAQTRVDLDSDEDQELNENEISQRVVRYSNTTKLLLEKGILKMNKSIGFPEFTQNAKDALASCRVNSFGISLKGAFGEEPSPVKVVLPIEKLASTQQHLRSFSLFSELSDNAINWVACEPGDPQLAGASLHSLKS